MKGAVEELERELLKRVIEKSKIHQKGEIIFEYFGVDLKSKQDSKYCGGRDEKIEKSVVDEEEISFLHNAF